jgi:type IV secretion system protein TrbL
MASLRRVAALALTVAAVAVGGSLLAPTEEAKAIAPCAVAAPADAVTGAVGIGSPVGDACEVVADPALDAAGVVLDPLEGVAGAIGEGVFEQITDWSTDGAVWLLGRVAELTSRTTAPDLLSKGFLRQYREMASIAVVLALMMLIFAAVESLGRGDAGMLWRVLFVNVPLAALATSAAYVVVQLMVAATDGFCEVITRSTAEDTRAFFKSAIKALSESGQALGAAPGNLPSGSPAAEPAVGGAAVPLFVSFIAASIAAFGAFLIWLELLMRSAAIYATALFMPFAIAAAIWPRWMAALRRTAELLIVVVSSKFVIVAIIALAASLLASPQARVELVLTAGALLLLASFSPLVLFKWVPMAEGAVGSAFNRQGGGGVVSARSLDSSVHMVRRAAAANWGGARQPNGSSARTSGGGSSASAPNGSAFRGKEALSGGGGEGVARAASAGGPAGAVLVAGAAAAGAAKAAGERLGKTGVAKSGEVGSGAEAGEASAPAPSGEASSAGRGGGRTESPAPLPPRGAEPESGERGATSAPSRASEPREASGGDAPDAGRSGPRPSAEPSRPIKGGDSGKAKR